MTKQRIKPVQRMTPAEFAAVAPTFKRMQPRNIALARKILVEGRSMADVAREHEITLQRAKEIRDFFLSAQQKLFGFPSHWVTAQVTAPREDLESFLSEIEIKRKKWLES
jgi:hypothetical protein